MRKRKRKVIGFTGLLTSSAFGPSCIEDKMEKKKVTPEPLNTYCRK
jgi:hypothetical protein